MNKKGMTFYYSHSPWQWQTSSKWKATLCLQAGGICGTGCIPTAEMDFLRCFVNTFFYFTIKIILF